MRLEKLMAMILLSVYGLVFVHDIIPHCHTDQSLALTWTESGSKHASHLDYHDHTQVQEHSNQHGPLDYVVCFLVNLNHSDDQGHGDQICASGIQLTAPELSFVHAVQSKSVVEQHSDDVSKRFVQNTNIPSEQYISEVHLRRGPPALS